jgi:natural product biosynthesis luciferase-like monooxygenase protein
MSQISETFGTDIAIIGRWCRLPGASSPREFWTNLCEGRESISTLTRQQLLDAGVAATLADDPRYVPRRGLLDHATDFDPAFFGLTPSEATLTDPQHRQFMECAWLALADAGYTAGDNLAKVGVYAAQSQNGYRPACDDIATEPNRRFQADINCAAAHLAANVAYGLDLHGPALSVQTACSSSLVAVHLACQALLTSDCDMALAGGVSIGWPQHVGHLHIEGGIMSRDGHCRPFDNDASGTVRGEGVGVVVLKPLHAALRDRDTVRAVIRGSATNNDGRRKVGYTAPAARGQIAVIKAALDRAGLDGSSISYVEAHGTATTLGDAIELDALVEALGGSPCRVGSVKGNIGHLDAAAGIAGLIKATLMLEHGLVPPTLHFQTRSTHITAASPLDIATALAPWPGSGPRRCGISAFGLGGTNAHVVIEQAPAVAHASNQPADHLVVLSADTPDAVRHAAIELATTLANEPDATLGDVAYTLARGRRVRRWRTAVVANSIAALRTRLAAELVIADSDRSERPLAFIFPPRISAATVPRLAQLYRTDASFRRRFDTSAGKLAVATGSDPAALLFEASHSCEARESLAFCSAYALAHQLLDCGVQPMLTGGTGVGACVAACVSGHLALADVGALIAEKAGGATGDVLARSLQDRLSGLKLHTGRLRWQCSFTGDELTPSQALSGAYWAHVFDSVAVTEEADCPLAVRRYPPAECVNELPADRFEPAPSGRVELLLLLGQAWMEGADIDWSRLNGDSPRQRIPLPHPPFQRIRLEPPGAVAREALQPRQRVLTPVTIDHVGQAEALVTALVDDVLGIIGSKASDDFFAIGGCSITVLDLREKIAERTGKELALRELFDAPNLGAVARAILEPATPIASRPDAAHSEAAVAIALPMDPSPALRYQGANRIAADAAGPPGPCRFSVFFFSGEASDAARPDAYEFVLEAARFADTRGFKAVWTPERHFHRFGGLFPAPAVLAAAISTATRRIAVRAGSVVLPLHDPLRIVEEWSVVDNLSHGRVGVSFAPGFHPTDFIARPSAYDTRRTAFWPSVDLVRSLWRGAKQTGPDGLGRAASVTTLPRPLQSDLPTWITASESLETFVRAGEIGANILTGLMAHDVSQLENKISAYRAAFKGARPDARGQVTVMVHAYIHPDRSTVEHIGHHGLRGYLDSHLDFASARVDYERMTGLRAGDREAILDHAVARYLNGRSLIGTPAECAIVAKRLASIGVDEIACLIDFGPASSAALASLSEIDRLRSDLARDFRDTVTAPPFQILAAQESLP